MGFFDLSAQNSSTGKFRIARGGSVVLENVTKLSTEIQKLICDAMSFEEERKLKGFKITIRGWAFIGPQNWTDNEQTNLTDPFLNSVSGHTITSPGLAYRSVLKKIALHMLKEMSPEHVLSPAALAYLENAPWPGNLRQLRKVLRQSISNADGKVIRGEIKEVLNIEDSEIMTGCQYCSNSPVRSKSCIMIQKTWIADIKHESLTNSRQRH